MPTGNHSNKSDLKEVPRSRHRAKPKFDIPVESASAEPTVGWVYRAELEEVALPAPQAESAPHSASAGAEAVSAGAEADAAATNATGTKKTARRDPFVMMGEGLFLVGLGAMTLVIRAASEFVVAPVRVVGMLRRR